MPNWFRTSIINCYRYVIETSKLCEYPNQNTKIIGVGYRRNPLENKVGYSDIHELDIDIVSNVHFIL